MSEQYLIAREGEQSGPYTLEQIRQMQADGQLLPSDIAWTEGQEDWLPISQIVDVAAPPPPPPQASATPKSKRGVVVWIVRGIVLTILVASIVLLIFDVRAKGQRQKVFETINDMESQVQLGKVREITGRDYVDKKEEGDITIVTYSWRGGLRKHLLVIRYDGYNEESGVGYVDELELR